VNCHPHRSRCGKFALVHNGIVENFQLLKAELIAQGETFDSDTDTEVILRLIEAALADYATEAFAEQYRRAVSVVFERLEGYNTLVLLAADEALIIGVRHGSPLVIGQRDDEIFLASDYNAFAKHTQRCLLLDNRQMIVCNGRQPTLYDLKSHQALDCRWQVLPHDDEPQDKDGFPHYMLKEICEQWRTISRAAQLDLQQLSAFAEQIRAQGHLYVTGAGAAFFVGEQIAWMIRRHTNIKVTCIPAYEGEGYIPQMTPNDLLLAISQSGETADTLRLAEAAQRRGVTLASVVNMPGAMLSRQSTFAFYSRSGAEVCVLSTKSSTAQLTFGFLLLGALNQSLSEMRAEIDSIPAVLNRYLNWDSRSDFVELADAIESDHLYLLGNGVYHSAAKIGALNIKEASYVHAEAFCAGELKHGVIALVETGTPVICFVDHENEKYMSAIASEVKARGGIIIGIAEKPSALFDFHLDLPCGGMAASLITSILPCQLLAYFLAIKKQLNPDRPRNLAKSVTVI